MDPSLRRRCASIACCAAAVSRLNPAPKKPPFAPTAPPALAFIMSDPPGAPATVLGCCACWYLSFSSLNVSTYSTPENSSS